MITLGAISCKAFLPLIYTALLANLSVSIISLVILSIVLWRKLKDATR